MAESSTVIDTKEARSHRRRVGVAISLVIVATAIILIRFAPADLIGWIAIQLHTSLGVALLLVSMLYLGAALLLRPQVKATNTHRGLYRAAIIGLVITFIPGILTIGTPI